MDDKILLKLKELKTELENLKRKIYREGEEEYYSIIQFLERAIDRIYPEKDAGKLKGQLHLHFFLAVERSEVEKQNEYTQDINRALRVINTTLEEFEIFGFNEFTPVKEKIETEASVKAGIFTFGRKKTKEK